MPELSKADFTALMRRSFGRKAGTDELVALTPDAFNFLTRMDPANLAGAVRGADNQIVYNGIANSTNPQVQAHERIHQEQNRLAPIPFSRIDRDPGLGWLLNAAFSTGDPTVRQKENTAYLFDEWKDRGPMLNRALTGRLHQYLNALRHYNPGTADLESTLPEDILRRYIQQRGAPTERLFPLAPP